MLKTTNTALFKRYFQDKFQTLNFNNHIYHRVQNIISIYSRAINMFPLIFWECLDYPLGIVSIFPQHLLGLVSLFPYIS